MADEATETLDVIEADDNMFDGQDEEVAAAMAAMEAGEAIQDAPEGVVTEEPVAEAADDAPAQEGATQAAAEEQPEAPADDPAMIPKARFDEVLGRGRAMDKNVADLTATVAQQAKMFETMMAQQAQARPAARPEPSPAQLAQSAIANLSEQYTAGDITDAEFAQQNANLTGVLAGHIAKEQVAAAMQQTRPAQPGAQQNNDTFLAQQIEQIETEAAPHIAALPSPEYLPLIAHEAKLNLARENRLPQHQGLRHVEIARETARLVKERYGASETAPVTPAQATQTVSPAIDKAAKHPPNLGASGMAVGAEPISPVVALEGKSFSEILDAMDAMPSEQLERTFG